MKLYVATALLVFCIIQCASADWRDDMKEKYISRFASFVRGMENLIQVSASTKNTATAYQCFATAQKELTDISSYHKSQVEKCVAAPAEQSQAIACCDHARKTLRLKASTISNVALHCIESS